MLRLYAACLGAVAVIAVPMIALAQGPFGPLRIGANRSKYVGACPVEVIFTGNINLNMPHPQGFTFNYHWERSDGAKGPVQVVHPPATERMMIVKEPWTLGAAGKHYDLWVKLFVNSGNTHIEQQSQTVVVDCK
jgi:hypothetical protein